MNTLTIITSEFTEPWIAQELQQFPLDEEVTIDFSAEAHVYMTRATLQPMCYTAIHKACNTLGRDASTITYLSGNVKEADNYEYYCSENNIEQPMTVEFKQFWMYVVRRNHPDLSFINNLTRTNNRSKHFVCLNMNSSKHRVRFVEQLIHHSVWDENIGYITAHWLGQDLGEGKFLEEWDTHGYKNATPEFVNAHADSYVDIVTETDAGSPWAIGTEKELPAYWQTIFFTEKIYRSIMNMRPFLLYGNQDSYKTLHQWGFRTFDGILFDESFDSEPDGEMRGKLVAEQVKKLVDNFTLKRLHNTVYSEEVQEILQHNRERFIELTAQEYTVDVVEHYMLNLSMGIEIDQPTLPLIELQNHDFNHDNAFYTLKNKLWPLRHKIKEEGAVIVDYSFEAPSIRQFADQLVLMYDLIYDNLEKIPEINPENIIYITGNQYEHDNYERWHKDNSHKQKFMNVAGRQTQIPATYHCEDLSYTSEGGIFKNKYALTMHRRPGIHRVNLLNSMCKRNLIDDNKTISKFNWDWNKHKSVIPNSPNQLEHILPKNTPEDDQVCYSEDYPQYYKDMFADTYYSIESETQADVYLETPGAVIKELYPWWKRMYFTEKIWRNIYWKRPFLLIGDCGMLQMLKEYGFKSLHNVLWDESYDLEPDWQKRTEMMLDQHEYITNSYTLEELHNKIYSKEVQDILEFNRQEFIKIAKGHK